MLSSRPRSGSFEAGLRSSVSKPKPRLERSKSTSKASPSPEKRGSAIGGGVMQQRVAQLEEEVRKEREEKSQALQELVELRKKDASLHGGSERMQILEKEVEKAKESERKMLESLIYQTKLLEQTKISLEEAKLEIVSLQESNRNLEASVKKNANDVVFGGAEEEVRVLRSELRSAMQGEEKSRKALDDLAIALSDVTMETKQVKIWLSETQSELEDANAEAERLKAELGNVQEKLRAVTEEYERFKLETEESAVAWSEKEKVFLECMKASEEEVNKAKQENTKLIESQRVIRDENARLRDILKQAVGEANVVKESLELARNENSRLNDVVSEKENALQSLRQDYECLKVSEAAAQGSLKELNSLLAATATIGTPNAGKTASAAEYEFEQQPKASPTDHAGAGEREMRLPSEQWKGEKPLVQNGRRHSIGEPAKFKAAFSDSGRIPNQKDRMFASLSNIADMKSAASAAMEDFDDDFDHIDGNHLDGMKQKKKRPILRKFGDLFRRKSFYKSNLASVHS